MLAPGSGPESWATSFSTITLPVSHPRPGTAFLPSGIRVSPPLQHLPSVSYRVHTSIEVFKAFHCNIELKLLAQFGALTASP